MDINFDLGVGDSNLGTTLGELRESFVKLRDESAHSRKEAEQAFQKMAEGGEDAAKSLVTYTKKTKEQAATIEALTKKLDELEKQKKDTFSSTEIVKYEKEIEELKQEVKGLGQTFEQTGTQATTSSKKMAAEFEVLAGVIEAAKVELQQMKPGAEFDKLSSEIKASQIAFNGLSKEVDENGNSLISNKKQLREMQEVMQDLKIAGLDTTEAYRNLSAQAGALKDTIGDVNEEIKQTSSDTQGVDQVIRGVDLLANSYGALQGIQALSGEEDENMQRTMVKLNTVMVISNGLQQVLTELRRRDNVVTAAQIGLQKLYAVVIGTSTGALKAFRIALAATGIGLLVIGLIALVQKMNEWSDSSEVAKEKAEDLNKVIDTQNNLLSQNLNGLNRRTSETIAALEAVGAKESEIARTRIFSLEQQRELREKDLADKAKAYDAAFKLDKESFEKAAEAYTASQESLKDLDSQIKIAKLQNQKQLADEQQKAADEYSKKAIAAEEKRLKAIEERNKRILELEKQLTEARLGAIAESREKEIAIEKEATAETVKQLKENYGKAYGKEKQLIQANLEQEQLNHNARLLAIDIGYYNQAIEALQTANKTTADFLLGDREKEKSDIRDRFASALLEIKDAQKKIDDAVAVESSTGRSAAGSKTLKLLKEREKLGEAEIKLSAQINKELQEADLQFDLQALADQEELYKAQLDLLRISGVSEEELTKLKEQNKLQITIDFAKKQLELLEKIGGEENALRILQIRKVIQDAENELSKSENATGERDLFDILGLKMSDAEKQAVVGGFMSLANSISDLFTASINARIEESERLIAQFEKQINAQENIVDREKELMKEGRANSFSVEQQKLNDLKAQKAKEVEELEKAQKKEAEIAAAQIVINGVLAASNLAVSAANFFAQSSKYGPIAGTILALAAIGTMLTTFVAAKKQANASARDVESFNYGGGIDLTSKGSSHQAGGISFYDNNGKQLGEARQGEYGYFFKDGNKAKQFKPLFDFINSDKAFTSLLSPIGLKIPLEGTKRDMAKASEASFVIVPDSANTPLLVEQNETLKQIAANTGKSTAHYPGYRVETEKNRVRKILN